MLQGPRVIDNAVLALGSWTPEFQLSVDELPKCVVWVRLPDLPLLLWTQSVLSLVVSKARALVRLDNYTELLSKGRYVRVAVEINLSKPLLPGTDIKLEGLNVPSFWQSFQHENIHLYCHRCGHVGNRASLYSFTLAPLHTPSVATPSGDSSPDVEMAQEGRIAFPATNDDLGSVGDRKHVCRRHGYPRTSSTISKDMLPSLSRAPVHDTFSRVSTHEPVPFLAGPSGVNGIGPGFGPLDPVKKPELSGILGNGLSSSIAQAKPTFQLGLQRANILLLPGTLLIALLH